jgi:hypothetical protein
MSISAAKNIERSTFDMEELSWGDVRDEVYAVNPELAKICDQINPGKKHTLLKIRYPYGSKIVDKGQFNVPSIENGLISLKDSRVPLSIKKNLNYSPIPFSLVLDNNTEVFVETNERVIPLNFFEPGEVFGIFESVSFLTDTPSNPIWSVTAGARSVFMIPRITDKIGHKRIRKEFGITNEVPTDLSGQWKIFKSIHDGLDHTKQWHNTILVFTDNWFQKHDEDISWLKFHKYLFKLCWSQLQLFRDATEFSLLWSSFGDEINNRNLKPRPYLVDTLKHLVSIANGSGVAFRPAIDETALPVSLIQNAYVDFYNLKEYMPTLMQPCKLQGDDTNAYYSLAFPTVLESSPYTRNAPSIIEDERDIKRLMDTLIRTIKHGKAIIDPIKHVSYEFFHTDVDPYGEILESKEILAEDSRFSYTSSSRLKDRTFCATSPFFRGCIRISLISEK